MSPRIALLVFRKELLETLRDRRTLFVMVVLPLCLYPVVGIGVTQWVGAERAKREAAASRVGIAGARWSQLEQALSQSGKVVLDRERADEQALRRGQIDLVLRVPADYRKALDDDGTVELKLTYDDAQEKSGLAVARVEGILSELSDQIRVARLESRALPRSLVQPLQTVEKQITTGGSKGARVLSSVIPLLVILMVLLGAFYPAIDVTAGEKERGTLETLLVTPVDRTSLIAGKYLAVAAVATFTGLLNMGSIGLTIGLGFGPALREAGLTAEVPWAAVALTGAAMVPAALFFAAVMMAVAALGRSFKEAQNLLTPVYLMCMLPAMATQLPGIELDLVTALLPVVNVSLLTKGLIAGRLDPMAAGVTVLSLLLYTAVALKLAARVFESERLLFAPDPGLGAKGPGLLRSLFAAGDGPRASAPTSLQAAALLLAVMALIVLVGQPLQARSLVGGLLVTEWLLIGLPTLLVLRLGRLDGRAVLALRAPRPAALLGALLAGLSAWYLVGVLVETVQQRILPMPPEMLRAYHKALFDTDRSLLVDLTVLAISPAICEEVLFRGVLLQATRRTMSTTWAVVINGVLFGLFHMSPYRFLSTMILGMVLALIVLRSGSILPAMLFHLLNNASAVVAGRLVGADPTAAPEAAGAALSLPLAAAAALVFALGMGLVVRRRAPDD